MQLISLTIYTGPLPPIWGIGESSVLNRVSGSTTRTRQLTILLDVHIFKDLPNAFHADLVSCNFCVAGSVTQTTTTVRAVISCRPGRV